MSGVATFRVRTKDISLVRQFTLLFVLVLFFRVFAICLLNLSFMPFFFLSFLFLYFFLFLFFLFVFSFFSRSMCLGLLASLCCACCIQHDGMALHCLLSSLALQHNAVSLCRLFT